MSMEASIFAALQSLVSGRVYPDVAPEKAGKPYITYQQVGGEGVNFIDQATVPSRKNARVQVNVWADTRLAASGLARQVEDTLRAVTALQVTVLGAATALYEKEAGLFGTRQDFSVWF